MARGRRLRAALLLFLTVAKNFFLLPSPSFFSFSVAVCSRVGFGFLVSVSFFSVCFCSSLSFVPYVSSPSLFGSSSFSFFFSLPLRSSLFIDNKTEQVCLLLVRLQSRNGWSAIGASSVAVGAKRERGSTFENFCLSLLIRGGRKKMNSVVQNDTFLVPFIYIYIYETASFWIKRVVSFKLGKLQISPPHSIPAPIVGRIFHFGPWPLIYAIKPSIDQ